MASSSPPAPAPAEAPRALRVSQIDAEELDDGLVGMLASKLESALNFFGPNRSSSLRPELHLALRLVVYRLGVMAHPTARSSPGMLLQNTKYVSAVDRAAPLSARSIYLLPTLHLLPPYLISRLRNYLLSKRFPDHPRESWQRRLWVIVEGVEVLGKGWELAGLVGFLLDGRYPNLHSRLLNILQVPIDDSGTVSRSISYEFMNRQLVWTGITEFLLCLLPILRSHHHHLTRPLLRRLNRLRSLLRLLLSSKSIKRRDYTISPPPTDSSSLDPESKENGNGKSDSAHGAWRKRRGPLWKLPKEVCAVCYRRIHQGIDKEVGLPALEVEDFLAEEAEDEEDVVGQRIGREAKEGAEQEDEETRIHIPARGDCEEKCVYCYHCLAKALVEQAQAAEKQAERDGEDANGDEESRVGGWKCLRCGDEVWSCERVGLGGQAGAKSTSI